MRVGRIDRVRVFLEFVNVRVEAVTDRSDGKSREGELCGWGSVEEQPKGEVDRSGDDTLCERDLRRGVAVEAGGDGVVDSPAHACGSNE